MDDGINLSIKPHVHDALRVIVVADLAKALEAAMHIGSNAVHLAETVDGGNASHAPELASHVALN